MLFIIMIKNINPRKWLKLFETDNVNYILELNKRCKFDL